MPALLFDAPARELPAPLVDPSEDLRERLIYRVAALMAWKTPEDIAACEEACAWPSDVTRLVERDREELAAHVDMLLSIVELG